jgi:predicted Zn-dependent protease
MYQKAATLLKEAVDQFPDQPTVVFHYGMAQYGNNNTDEAQKALKRFLTLNPSDPNAGKAKEALATLEHRI